MKNTVFDVEDLRKKVPFLQCKGGNVLAKLILRILAIHKTNKIYSQYAHLKGPEFIEAYFKHIGISYHIEHKERLTKLPSTAFVTISNHSYGALDGMIMIDMISRLRPDYKFLVNDILLYINTLTENFIGIKPMTSPNDSKHENVNGLKVTLRHISNGHPIGFFPAGAVANYYHSKTRLTDKDWQLSIIKLIQAAKAPVYPIFIHGHNSHFFNYLGRISWQLRSLRMIHEIYNKKGKCIKVSIGNPISPETLEQYKDTKALANFLRKKTFELRK